MTPHGPPVTAEDESLHPPQPDPYWAESFYLNFFDTQTAFGGLCRTSVNPKQMQTDGLLGLYLSDGRVGVAYATNGLTPPESKVISAGPLSVECLEPLQRWRIRFDGIVHVFDDPELIPAASAPGAITPPTLPMKIDLVATGVHHPVVYGAYKKVPTPAPFNEHVAPSLGRTLRRGWRRPGEIWSALSSRSARHYEQSMNLQGIVRAGDSDLAFEGTGVRDHSWGRRDWGSLSRMRWLTCKMDGFAFNAVLITVAGTHVTNGWVWTGDECAVADAVHLENTFDATGRAGRDLNLKIEAMGKQFQISGKVLQNIPLPLKGPGYSKMYTVGLTEYRYDGKVGRGVAEFFESLYP